MDPATSNYGLFSVVPKSQRVLQHSPVAVLKATKNATEREGLRESCLRDSAAIVEYLAWLTTQLKEGAKLTEFEGAERLREFRQEKELFVGPSFGTISSTGANAAIIHYHPEKETSAVIDSEGMYLCDSGGQYL